MSSAAGRTFAISELLENILVSLGERLESGGECLPAIEDLFILERVNTTFRNVIRGSKKLQVLMHLAYEEGDENDNPTDGDNFGYLLKRAVFLPIHLLKRQDDDITSNARLLLRRECEGEYELDVVTFAVQRYAKPGARIEREIERTLEIFQADVCPCLVWAMFQRQTYPGASWRKMKVTSKPVTVFRTLRTRCAASGKEYNGCPPFEPPATLGGVYDYLAEITDKSYQEQMGIGSRFHLAGPVEAGGSDIWSTW